MSLGIEFPERESIRAKAFALRHALLQHGKDLRSFAPLSSEEKQLIDSISERLFVELPSRSEGYVIYLDSVEVARVAFEEAELYVRGDRLGDIDPQNRKSLPSSIIRRVYSDILRNQGATSPLDSRASFSGVSCVFPCLNEEGNIGRAVRVLANALQLEKVERNIIEDFEIIVVDDGSTDRTADEVLDLVNEIPEVKLVRHPRNRGYGAALYSGFSRAKFDLVFFSDSDNQFNYAQIRELLPHIRFADIVCGERVDRQDPPIRKLNAWGWNRLIRFCFGSFPRDIDCAFKLFRRNLFRDIDLRRIRGRGAIINTEIFVRAKQHRARIIQVPVKHYPRELGVASGASPLVILRALWELIKLFAIVQVERLTSLASRLGLYTRKGYLLEQSSYPVVSADAFEVQCRICGSSGRSLASTDIVDWSEVGDSGHSTVIICRNCRNGFTVRPESSPVQPFESPAEPRSWIERTLSKRFLISRAKRVEAATGVNRPLTVLDCSQRSGGFSGTMTSRGHKVLAWQPNPESPRSSVDLKSSKPSSHSPQLASERYDVVTMWQSLQHFNDPRSVLRATREMLPPGGVVYICVPNLSSFQAEVGGGFWAYFNLRTQYVHFSLNGLLALLDEEGFEGASVHWYSVEYDVFGFYQTLLNLLSRTHNYYYNTRRGTSIYSRPLRMWGRVVHKVAPVLVLPLAIILSAWSAGVGRMACAEVHAYAPTDGKGE